MVFIKRCSLGVLALIALVCAWRGGKADEQLSPDAEKSKMAAGRELFTREWLPGDRRSHAGDGLGPVFNARSCAACHHQGGVGGAGPKHTNATIVSVFVTREPIMVSGLLIGSDTNLKQPDRAKLAEIHPALRTESSFPLHRFGMEKDFTKWKADILGERPAAGGANDQTTELDAHAALSMMAQSLSSPLIGAENTKKIDGVHLKLIASQRNAPALFGDGLIDRIPDRVIEEVAAEQATAAAAGPKNKAAPKAAEAQFGLFTKQSLINQFPLPLTGRVARLKDGRIGRFGWKSNVATLREFTLQACANEVGLEVPGFARAVPPWRKDYKAPGLDMTAEQCDSLVRFVASLPPPAPRAAETPQHTAQIAAGQKLFSSVGCAACHQPTLGQVEGIYSDLLLHDMGHLLSDTGSYGTSIPVTASGNSAEALPVDREMTATKTREKPPKFGAAAREWRTPPLWGLRDSAPYLHDGRADTIADAVALHFGEGLLAAQGFFKLTARERQQVELFLQSLAAPSGAR